MNTRIRKNKAQAIMEYALLVAMIAAAFTGMQIYMRRAVDSNIAKLDKEMQTKNIITPCSHNPCASNACRPEDCCDNNPCSSDPCPNAGFCCTFGDPKCDRVNCAPGVCCNTDPCVPGACNPEDCPTCSSDPCSNNPCADAGRCCDQASPNYDNNPCAADHCSGGSCCSDVCNSNACAPAPNSWCQNGGNCTANPCLSWEQNTAYCASECGTCKDNCLNKVETQCMAGCDSDQLNLCNNVVYGQCQSAGRTSCGYSAQNTYCCNSCGTCAARDTFSQLRQGNFMLAGGIAAQASNGSGSFILAEDLPGPGDQCYSDCMANVNNCVNNYISGCRYSCSGFSVGSGITLSGCQGNSSMGNVLSGCLQDYASGYYAGVCGVNPPTPRSCCTQRCTYGLISIGIDRVEGCYGTDCGHSYGWLSSH